MFGVCIRIELTRLVDFVLLGIQHFEDKLHFSREIIRLLCIFTLFQTCFNVFSSATKCLSLCEEYKMVSLLRYLVTVY